MTKDGDDVTKPYGFICYQLLNIFTYDILTLMKNIISLSDKGVVQIIKYFLWTGKTIENSKTVLKHIYY